MKKLKLIILACTMATTLAAQPLLKVLPAYECVHYDKNVLNYPAGNESMRYFYTQLDSLLLFRQGNINILHIGGSHVQADYLTHRIRTDLIGVQPELQAMRGIIFPHNVAKMNTARNYNIKYQGEWEANRNSRKPFDFRMGLTGMAIRTSDADAEISFCLNRPESSLKWEFDRLRILGYASSDSVVPMLLLPQDTLLSVFDSVTSSYVFQLPAMTDTACIHFSIPNHNEWFTLTGIIPENNLQGINYYSVGVNGAAVPAWLRCTDFERDLQLVKPQLVVMGIGINDAAVPYGDFDTEKFKQNYRMLIERILRVSPQCAFVFITNNDSYRSVSRKRMAPNQNGELAQQAFYDLAKEYKGAVWDVFAFMGGQGSVEQWAMSDLMQRDKLHFNKKGYELLGDMFYNAFISDYLEY